jgi:hypothetical protein
MNEWLVMRCQKCQDKVATVHIHGKRETCTPSGRDSSGEVFELHFCEACAEEYRRTELSRSLFPNDHDEKIIEHVRVLSVTPERTVLRLIRTEADATPQDWSLLTSRLPRRQVGTEMTIAFTPSELEWMRGARELS